MNICKTESTTEKTIDTLNLGDTCLVITMGKDGVIIKEKNELSFFPVTDVPNIVHPGGAGDAFATGYIFAEINGLTKEECCQKGHECAKIMLESSNIETVINKFTNRK